MLIRKTLIALGASIALVLGTGGAALASDTALEDPDKCYGTIAATYKDVPNPHYVPADPGTPGTPAKYGERKVITVEGVEGELVNHIWHGQGDSEPAWNGGEGWKSNEGNHNGGEHQPAVSGRTYSTSDGNGRTPWFHWELVGHVDEVSHMERYEVSPAIPGRPSAPAVGTPTIQEIDVAEHRGEVPCDYPAPTAFNADPTPPTCDAPGAFDVDLGGTFVGEVNGVRYYDFDGGVRLSVERVPGAVNLYVFVNDDAALLHLTGLSSAWTVSPDGRSATRTVVLADRLDPLSEACTFPVPAPFNAEPTGPTCEAAGTFDAPLGGEFLVENDGVRYYAFADGTVRLSVDRTVPGVVNLYVFVFDPSKVATITNLSDAWTTAADGRSATRTITLGDRLPSPSLECPVTVQVPVQLNADPTPPTCDAAGTFSEDFGGDLQGEGDGYTAYRFEHIGVLVNHNVPGQVSLSVSSDDGYLLGGLSEDWTVYPDGRFATRTVVVGAQLSGPVACPVGTLPGDEVPAAGDPAVDVPAEFVSEVLGAGDPAVDVPAGFVSEVLAAGDPAQGELAHTGSDGVAITVGAALLLTLSGLGLTAIRRRATS